MGLESGMQAKLMEIAVREPRSKLIWNTYGVCVLAVAWRIYGLI